MGFSLPSDKQLEILRLLASQPEGMYGLELIRASGDRLSRGTIYVTLGRMEEKGYVKSRIDKRANNHPGLPRPIYRITAEGSRVLSIVEALRLKLAEA